MSSHRAPVATRQRRNGSDRPDDNVDDSAIDNFFDQLAKLPDKSIFRGHTGTIAFDLATDGRVEHWYAVIGESSCSGGPGDAPADARIQLTKDLFKRIVTGRTNAMAAVLRGAMAVEGDVSLAMSFDRIFPGPPPATQASTDRRRRH